jgi:predicted dienelactone hydrolase
LDTVLSSGAGPYGTRIDRRRIVAAGHSHGANTTLLAVGAQVMREGQWVEACDPRFAAAIVISTPPFYGEHDLTSVLNKDHGSEPAHYRDRRRHRKFPDTTRPLPTASPSSTPLPHRASCLPCFKAGRTACSPIAH